MKRTIYKIITQFGLQGTLARLGAAVLGATFAMGSAQAATLDVVGGELVGASGVDIGGTLYDVSFSAENCNLTFDGCDELSDFFFITEADALAASEALGDQVFVDGVSGQFGSIPGLTIGCDIPTFCRVLTPYEVFFESGSNASFAEGAAFTNTAGSDGTEAGRFISIELGSFPEEFETFAVWSRAAVAPVPLPAGLPLLLVGLGGLAVLRKRKMA